MPKGYCALGGETEKKQFSLQGMSTLQFDPKMGEGSKGGTVERFKTQLNRYLSVVPDCPHDVLGGYYPDPYNPDVQTSSKSLIHWGAYLRELRLWWDW